MLLLTRWNLTRDMNLTGHHMDNDAPGEGTAENLEMLVARCGRAARLPGLQREEQGKVGMEVCGDKDDFGNVEW